MDRDREPNGHVCVWFSRTQGCVSLSSSEGEYIAMGGVVWEILFLRQVLGFMQPNRCPELVLIYEGNDGAIQLAKNPLSSQGRST